MLDAEDRAALMYWLGRSVSVGVALLLGFLALISASIAFGLALRLFEAVRG